MKIKILHQLNTLSLFCIRNLVWLTTFLYFFQFGIFCANILVEFATKPWCLFCNFSSVSVMIRLMRGSISWSHWTSSRPLNKRYTGESYDKRPVYNSFLQTEARTISTFLFYPVHPKYEVDSTWRNLLFMLMYINRWCCYS